MLYGHRDSVVSHLCFARQTKLSVLPSAPSIICSNFLLKAVTLDDSVASSIMNLAFFALARRLIFITVLHFEHYPIWLDVLFGITLPLRVTQRLTLETVMMSLSAIGSHFSPYDVCRPLDAIVVEFLVHLFPSKTCCSFLLFSQEEKTL